MDRTPTQHGEVVLGIDPGTVVTGYAFLRREGHTLTLLDFGCITPPRSSSLHERYAIIHRGIISLIEKYHPSAMAIETQYVNKNVQSALKLGMARGVITLAATLNGIPVEEYSPTKAKKAVVGTGGASKGQIQDMLQMLLRLKQRPEPEDAADAIALAYCHMNQRARRGA